MNTHSAHPSRSPEDRERERDYWREHLDAYVDGQLDDKQALRLHLFAEKDEVLAAELASTRRLFQALDVAPRSDPAPGFDARVLAALPLGKYESAPRQPDRVLVLGEDESPQRARIYGSARRGLYAVAAAYLLFLGVSHSALSGLASALSQRTSDGLSGLAARTQELPVLSGVVGFLSRAYDAAAMGVASFADTVGEGLVTFVAGVVLGVLVLALYSGARRRSESRRLES